MDVKFLISKYLENKCSPEEKLQLVEMLLLPDNEKFINNILLGHLNEYQESPDEVLNIDFERIYNELLSEINRRKAIELEWQGLQKRIKVRRLIYGGLSIAAVFCIAFFLGNVVNRQNDLLNAVQSDAVRFTEIKAPLGARSEIRLSDGSEVTLNAGSSLVYNSDYNSMNRELTLEGEAYFKVSKNDDLPLIVKAGNINIKAIGTEFNVKAYADEGIIETTLVTGEVEISQKFDNDKDHILVLEPNQKAIYASGSDKLTLEKIKEMEPLAVKPAQITTDKLLVSPKTDVEQVTAWTRNKLIIKSENLESLCTKLQRKYDVTFIFMDEEIKQERFSGILLDETFQQVMDIIMLTAPIDYSLDGKTVTMTINKEKAGKYSKNLNKNL